MATPMGVYTPLPIGQEQQIPTSNVFDTGNLLNQQQTSGLFGLDTQTWGNIGTGVQAASGLAQSWMGFQNLNLAKEQLAFQRNAWQEQFDIQKEEYDYQKERRDARSEAYAEARANVNKANL